MTDSELFEKLKGGDKSAETELLNRYSPLAKAVAAGFFLSGGTSEDLFQEGMVGLYSAINTFDSAGGAQFSSYAYTCIRHAVLDAVKKSLGAKYSALNNFVPIVEIAGNMSPDDPEDELIKREQRGEFLQKISGLLSSLEFKVTVLYLDGLSTAEMAKSLKKPQKSVSNALARAKNKLYKSYYSEG